MKVRIVRLKAIGEQILMVISETWLYVKEEKDRVILSNKPFREEAS